MNLVMEVFRLVYLWYNGCGWWAVVWVGLRQDTLYMCIFSW